MWIIVYYAHHIITLQKDMRFVITLHTSEPPEKFTQLVKTLRREFKKCPMAGCAIVAVTHCEDAIYAFSGKQIIHLRRTQALSGVSAIICQHGQPDLPNWVTDWKLKGEKSQPKMYDIVWWYDLIHGIVAPGSAREYGCCLVWWRKLRWPKRRTGWIEFLEKGVLRERFTRARLEDTTSQIRSHDKQHWTLWNKTPDSKCNRDISFLDRVYQWF